MDISISSAAGRPFVWLRLSERNLRDLVQQVETAKAAGSDARVAHLERLTPVGLLYVDVESDADHYGERVPGPGGYGERPSSSPLETQLLRQRRARDP